MFGILPSGLEWRKVPEYRVCGKSPLGGWGARTTLLPSSYRKSITSLLAHPKNEVGFAKHRNLFRKEEKTNKQGIYHEYNEKKKRTENSPARARRPAATGEQKTNQALTRKNSG
jgi:hypothetical protein